MFLIDFSIRIYTNNGPGLYLTSSLRSCKGGYADNKVENLAFHQ